MFPTKHIPAFKATTILALLGASQAALAMTISTITSELSPRATDAVGQEGGDFVFTVINSHTAAISTLHGEGAGSPTATRKDTEGNILKPQETATFSVPTGWFGRLAMYEQGFEILDRATLLEGSFFVDARGHAAMAMDVSYVDGFTVPMVCECDGQVAFGCNINLNDVCPPELQANSRTCINPYRDNAHAPGDSNVFKYCEKMAYTYPTDDLATKVDVPGCSRNVTCCIGTACKHHPGQLKCPAGHGDVMNCADL